MSPLRLRGGVSTVAGFPQWLVTGVLIGIALSVCVAGVFVLGARVYPTRRPDGSRRNGDARRRAEIRYYLDTIGEAYAENHPVQGHTVAFYLPGRDVAITFDARAFYAIEASPTYAILVEHEMPGIHIGARLPFETPEMEFDSGDNEGGGPPTAHAVLGVSETATDEQVRDAYRTRVKETHPDQGGDREEFQQVREAYAALIDRRPASDD